MGLPTPPCHKKTKKHFDSETGENVLRIGFLERFNKKKKKKKEHCFCSRVFKKYQNHKRKENIKKCGKTQKNAFFFGE